MASIEQKRLQIQQTGYKQHRSEMVAWFATGLANIAIAGAFFHYYKAAAIMPAIATFECFKQTHQSFKRMGFDAHRLKHTRSEIKES